MQAVLREAMDAGAAGFATSFAPTHRGVDGKPVPSRFAERAELEALLDVHGARSGAASFSLAPGEQCRIDDMYDLQLRTGVPFTYGALLTMPDRRPQAQRRASTATGWARRRAGVAAGDARARWSFAMTHGRRRSRST